MLKSIVRVFVREMREDIQAGLFATINSLEDVLCFLQRTNLPVWGEVDDDTTDEYAVL